MSVASALLACAAPAGAQGLPDTLADMLREASPAERDTLEDVAKRLYPDRRQQVDDLIDDIEDAEKAARSEEKFLAGWEGDGAVGASLSSGNTDEWSLTLSADVTREGPQWEHNFTFGVDIREVNSQRTDEKIELGYRVRRDFGDTPWFAIGALQYDRNRFQGYTRRFTEGLGVGYQLVDTDDVDWEVSAGPALRQTLYVDGLEDRRLATFAATDFKLDITDTLAFRQQAHVVLDESNTSASATTSFSSDLYGNLSARLSFTADYESDPADGRKKLDTTSRLSLVFGL